VVIFRSFFGMTRSPSRYRARQPIRHKSYLGGTKVGCAGHLAGLWMLKSIGPAVSIITRSPTSASRPRDVGSKSPDRSSSSSTAELFEERTLRRVTANTRTDGERFLALAARFGVTATTVSYPMDEAPRALADLAHGRFGGAAVLYA
jgi:propanol-preferring alcohol dehydrogenase